MATVTEKPSSGMHEGTIIQGGHLGVAGNRFYIKYQDGDLDFYSPTSESTGDGDAAKPQFENNGMLYGNLSFRGAMIASQAVGLANLTDKTKNPVTLTLLLGGTRKLDLKMVLDRISIRHSLKGPWVGVAISGHMHDTAPADLEKAIT